MNLVADESVDRQIVEGLRFSGHQVLFIAELHPGINDETVLSHSNHRNALLITADKDFGELVFRQRLLHAGVLLLRLAGLSPKHKTNLVVLTLDKHGGHLELAFSVLTERSLRIRKP